MNDDQEIIRMVKLHFHPDRIDAFLQQFDQIKDRVAGATGCLSLRLVQDSQYPNIVFTISVWSDESYLTEYRNSPFFKETWSTIKPWFAEKAQAWTTRTYYEQERTYFL